MKHGGSTKSSGNVSLYLLRVCESDRRRVVRRVRPTFDVGGRRVYGHGVPEIEGIGPFAFEVFTDSR